MAKISVKTPVKFTYNEITVAEWDLIHWLYNNLNQKITAIKFIRSQYDLGLKEAKDLCDAVALQPRIVASDGFTVTRGF